MCVSVCWKVTLLKSPQVLMVRNCCFETSFEGRINKYVESWKHTDVTSVPTLSSLTQVDTVILQTVPRPVTTPMALTLTATLDTLERQSQPPPVWGREHISPDLPQFRQFIQLENQSSASLFLLIIDFSICFSNENFGL